jgi:hypothetical protein
MICSIFWMRTLAAILHFERGAREEAAVVGSKSNPEAT